jgi:hypothetical protein
MGNPMMIDSDPFLQWVVYARPVDFPNSFVARLWKIERGSTVPTDVLIVCGSLEDIRARLRARGLTQLDRLPEDDRSIVEVWI